MSDTRDGHGGYGRPHGMMRTERQYHVLCVLAELGSGTAAEVAENMTLTETLVEDALDRALRQGFVAADVDRTPRYDTKSTAEYEILRHGQRWLDEFTEAT